MIDDSYGVNPVIILLFYHHPISRLCHNTLTDFKHNFNRVKSPKPLLIALCAIGHNGLFKAAHNAELLLGYIGIGQVCLA